jgi:hypothetical protein
MSVSPQNPIKKPLEKHDLFEFSHVFQHSFGNISASFWSISLKNTDLETPLVVEN